MAAQHPNPWAEPLPLPLEEMSHFLVIAPDLEDSRRLEVREIHLKQSAVGRELGWNVNGGPTFSPSSPSKMDGSWLLLRGVSAEAVKERVLRDIYAVEGAWDVDRITVQKVGAKAE